MQETNTLVSWGLWSCHLRSLDMHLPSLSLRGTTRLWLSMQPVWCAAFLCAACFVMPQMCSSQGNEVGCHRLNQPPRKQHVILLQTRCSPRYSSAGGSSSTLLFALFWFVCAVSCSLNPEAPSFSVRELFTSGCTVMLLFNQRVTLAFGFYQRAVKIVSLIAGPQTSVNYGSGVYLFIYFNS